MQDNYITDRLYLKGLHTDDAPFMLELVNTPGWLQFIGDRNIRNGDDALGYINRILANPDVHYWVVRIAGQGIPIGVITLIKRDYLDHHDIGFAFLPSYAGLGYAYEAAYAVLHDVIKDEGHSHISATTIRENTSSIKLLEKLGLQYSREIIADGETLDVYEVSTDRLLLNELVHTFFRLFSNKDGKEPEIDKIYSLCLPEAIIIKKEGVAEMVYDLNSFIAPRKLILTNDMLTGFEEYETEETTLVTGGIAQRHSHYRKRGHMNGAYFEGGGNKLFQFVNTVNGWKISALVWEDSVQGI